MGNYNFGNYIYEKRIEKKLSQNELGQLLGITNKTISKWENGQGFPSVELILPLSKILEVSVEEIHRVINNDNSEVKPNYFGETDTILTEELYKVGLYKGWNNNRINILIICSIIFLISIISIIIENNGWNNIVIFPILLLVLSISIIIKTKHTIDIYIKYFTNQKNFKRKYYLYDEYIICENEKITNKVFYSDIIKKKIFKNFLYLQTKTMMLFIDMDETKTKKIDKLLKILNIEKVSKEENKTKKLLNTFILLTIFSIFFALITIAILVGLSPIPNFPYAMLEYMWVFYIYIPIPITSIVLAIIYSKKRKTKINIIVGIVGIIVLCIYGSFIFLIDLEVEHDLSYINKVENTLLIDIPESNKISTAYMNDSYEKSITMIKLDESKINQFLNEIKTSDIWKDKLTYIPSMSYYISLTSNYDYFLLYNINSKTFNETQINNSEYIYMAYNVQENILFIINFISE